MPAATFGGVDTTTAADVGGFAPFQGGMGAANLNNGGLSPSDGLGRFRRGLCVSRASLIARSEKIQFHM
jgi:hypothetical protein